MTWNVENLFRPGDEFGPDTAAVYHAKIEALAATINAADPVLVGLQEVGDPDALGDLVAALDGDWHTVTSGQFDVRHPIRVAVISRLPLEVVADVAALPTDLAPVHANDSGIPITAMGRGALAVHVRTGADAGGLLFVTCHLKSKLLSYPAPPGKSRFQPRDEAERARTAAYALNRRAAEAVTVRGLADELLDGRGTSRRLVLGGDLNDEVQAATTQILLGPSPGSEFGTWARTPVVEHRRVDRRTAAVLPRLPGPSGTHRPRHGQPRPSQAGHIRLHHRSNGPRVDWGRSRGSQARRRFRSCPGPRGSRHLNGAGDAPAAG